MAISKHQTAFALLLIVALLPSLAAASGRMLRSSGYSNDIGEVFGCVFSVGPFDCNTAKGNADTASARSEALAADGLWSSASLHNGKGDAFRHCFWNALMARSIGAGQAKEVADGHEGASPSPAAEKDMDYYNNSRGRTIGSSAGSDAAAETGCKSAALSGSLHTCCGF